MVQKTLVFSFLVLSRSYCYTVIHSFIIFV